MVPSPLRRLQLSRKRPAFCDSLRSCKWEGFSLLEVVIALGLVSFSIIAILGLIPSGLNALQDSSGETIKAQIVRGIAGSALTANFSQLTTNNYFDSDGQAADSNTYPRYAVNSTLSAPSFPGSANGNFTSAFTALNVEIVFKAGTAATGITNNYTLHIANSGK